jgi:4-hydroxy-3-methylbut-2-en-1-yl diphosphate reductase
MKSFQIPEFYRSGLIGTLKNVRKSSDPKKKDFSPYMLDFGTVKFLMARHFGFCYGVENAIEISYKAIEENPGKRIFLLSQMIHNPEVNEDLVANGLQFIQDTEGNTITPWEEVTSEDVVIIPAFGTTVEIENLLAEKGIPTEKYNTTCPFVTRVWNRAEKLGAEGYAMVIHGKAKHEETRATFSHSNQNAPCIIIRDMAEAEKVATYMRGEMNRRDFDALFKSRYSNDFDPDIHLKKFGVINQTTMLATETQSISDFLRNTANQLRASNAGIFEVADTRDTLCYATMDNQQSTYALLDHGADVAFVVGGYNSSNTSHLVDLCKEKLPTYFIKNETEILSGNLIQHFDYSSKSLLKTEHFLPENNPSPTIIITSGASCPDAVLERVMMRLLSLYPGHRSVDEMMAELEQMAL